MNDTMTYEELTDFYEKSNMTFFHLSGWWIEAVWKLIAKNNHNRMTTFLEKIETLSYAVGIFQFDRYAEYFFQQNVPFGIYGYDSTLPLDDMIIDEIKVYIDEIIENDIYWDVNYKSSKSYQYNKGSFFYHLEEIFSMLEDILQNYENLEDTIDNTIEFIVKEVVKAFLYKIVLDSGNVELIKDILKKEWGVDRTALSLQTNDGFYEFNYEGTDISIFLDFEKDSEKLIELFEYKSWINGMDEFLTWL